MLLLSSKGGLVQFPSRGGRFGRQGSLSDPPFENDIPLRRRCIQWAVSNDVVIGGGGRDGSSLVVIIVIVLVGIVIVIVVGQGQKTIGPILPHGGR